MRQRSPLWPRSVQRPLSPPAGAACRSRSAVASATIASRSAAPSAFQPGQSIAYISWRTYQPSRVTGAALTRRTIARARGHLKGASQDPASALEGGPCPRRPRIGARRRRPGSSGASSPPSRHRSPSACGTGPRRAWAGRARATSRSCSARAARSGASSGVPRRSASARHTSTVTSTSRGTSSPPCARRTRSSGCACRSGAGSRCWQDCSAYDGARRPRGGRRARGLHEGARVREVRAVPGSVEVASDAGTVQAGIVVGAGGHGCPVARGLGRARGEEHVVVTQESETSVGAERLRALTPRHGCPELIAEPDFKGYGWYFTKGDFLNVGVGALGGEPIRRRLDRLLGRLRASGRLPDDLALMPFRGHAYAIRRGQPRRLGGERFALVGDAAGLARDVSGEGIGPAVRSACLAADALLAGRPATYAARIEAAFRRPARAPAPLAPPP